MATNHQTHSIVCSIRLMLNSKLDRLHNNTLAALRWHNHFPFARDRIPLRNRIKYQPIMRIVRWYTWNLYWVWQKELFNLVAYNVQPKKRKVTITLHLDGFKCQPQNSIEATAFLCAHTHTKFGPTRINLSRLWWENRIDFDENSLYLEKSHSSEAKDTDLHLHIMLALCNILTLT